MDSFMVFHAPTSDSDLPHGVYRLRDQPNKFPSAQLLLKCTYTSDAITIAQWLNERPTRAWANVLTEFGHVNAELTRAGAKLRNDAMRPTDVKVVLGRNPYGDQNLWHRIITCDDDLKASDEMFRTLYKFAQPDVVLTYWSFNGAYAERVLDDE